MRVDIIDFFVGLILKGDKIEDSKAYQEGLSLISMVDLNEYVELYDLDPSLLANIKDDKIEALTLISKTIKTENSVKVSKIITLDIDDCILPSDTTYIGHYSDNLELLEINLKRIKNIIKTYDAKVFITSSWHLLLDYDNNNIKVKKDVRLNTEEKKAYKLLNKYLKNKFIGISTGNRFDDVLMLLDKGYLVLNIDDQDMSSIKNENYLWIEGTGLISNRDLFLIHEFFGEHNKTETRD